MEYVDSTDELAYITSLEQQNKELLAALRNLMFAAGKYQSLVIKYPDEFWGAVSAIDKAMYEAVK
jgi:hypothetical protein